MFATDAGCVPAEADLVCYWFENAGRQIASSKGPGCRLYARKAAALAAGNDALEAKRVQMDRGAKPNACCIREAVRERWWLRRWSSGPLVKLCRSGILRTSYLGHNGVSSTYWYLEATPVLLRHIARQAEHAHAWRASS